MFIVNKILTPQYDWYWYTLLFSLGYGMNHYYEQINAPKLRIFSYLYIIFSSMVFLTWLNLHNVTEFPWFIYPICIAGLPLAMGYMYSVYSERRWYLYGAVVCIDINIMILITWGFMDTVLPWFFVPLVISLLILIIWWFFFTRGCCCCTPEAKQEEKEPRNQPPFQTTTTSI